MLTDREKKLLNKLLAVGDIDEKLTSMVDKSENALREMREIEIAVNKIIEEKTKGFPWLADAIAQYYMMRDLKISEFLEKKLKPAMSSAERVREISREKRILQKQFRITRNLIRYYETLFPWLPEFVGEDVDDLIEQVARKKEEEDVGDDPIRFYLTKAEYEKLSMTERNQRALDRYWKKKKSNWEIGRDYERYIGYLYEKEGYSIYYQGIVEGLEDLGRDLIAKRNGEVKIIQCKYWAKHRTIHEKHICQLFGTTLKYWIEQKKIEQENRQELLMHAMKNNEITGVFITTTLLSETAKEFANELEIEVKENFPFNQYPPIKCNISKRSGEKIYHLPMDQQYDRAIIEEERNECYAETVKEAENLGFRRAWKWKGNKE